MAEASSSDDPIVIEEEVESPKNYFATPSKFRTFRLNVEGKNLFVNPYFLAEMSDYFEGLCFGSFQESVNECAVLNTAKYDTVVEFLLVVGCMPKQERKEIDVGNCAAMLKLSDEWQVDALKQRCLRFLEIGFCRVQAGLPATVNMLKVVLLLGIQGAPLINLASRLASFGTDALLKNEIHKKFTDPIFTASLFEAASRQTLERDTSYERAQRHVWGRRAESTVEHECVVLDCREMCNNVCDTCQLFYCKAHLKQQCPVLVTGGRRPDYSPPRGGFLSYQRAERQAAERNAREVARARREQARGGGGGFGGGGFGGGGFGAAAAAAAAPAAGAPAAAAAAPAAQPAGGGGFGFGGFGGRAGGGNDAVGGFGPARDRDGGGFGGGRDVPRDGGRVVRGAGDPFGRQDDLYEYHRGRHYGGSDEEWASYRNPIFTWADNVKICIEKQGFKPLDERFLE